jgi:hypothetical protein
MCTSTRVEQHASCWHTSLDCHVAHAVRMYMPDATRQERLSRFLVSKLAGQPLKTDLYDQSDLSVYSKVTTDGHNRHGNSFKVDETLVQMPQSL